MVRAALTRTSEFPRRRDIVRADAPLLKCSRHEHAVAAGFSEPLQILVGLRYVVDRPVIIQEIRGSFPLFKYEGTLVAAIVGGAIRPVTPPVHIFFAIPERLDDAPLEGPA